MYLIKRDILDYIQPNNLTIIGHGCNTENIMQAGIAAYLLLKYPYIYVIDCSTKKGPEKLGTFSTAKISDNLYILNCYTQEKTGKGRQVDYEAVYKCLENVQRMIIQVKQRIGNQMIDLRFPQIGCGLAGGDWNIIEKMFDKLLPSAKIYYK